MSRGVLVAWRSRWLLWLAALCLYTIVVVNITRIRTLRDSRGSAAVPRAVSSLSSAPPLEPAAKPEADTTELEVSQNVNLVSSVGIPDALPLRLPVCPVARRSLYTGDRGDVSNKSRLDLCSGRGDCNAASGECACDSRFAGAACDVDLSALGDSGVKQFRQRLSEEASNARRGVVSNPRDNQLIAAAHVEKLLVVVLPIPPSGSESDTNSAAWAAQVKKSILRHYPRIVIIEVAMQKRGDALSGFGDHWCVACAWNQGLAEAAKRKPMPTWTLLLSPSVIEMHEHTNLELMLSLLLTTSIDVLGFSSLSPAVDEHSGALLMPRSEKERLVSPSGLLEFVFHTDVWVFQGPERWMLAHSKPLFGYAQHAGSYAVVGDRTSDSFIVPTSLQLGHAAAAATSATSPSPFSESMGVSALTDFFLRAKASRMVVATCVECLLKSNTESPFEKRSTPMLSKYVKWGSKVVLPPPWRTRSRLSQAFAEAYNVEAVVGPHTLDTDAHRKFQALTIGELEKPFSALQSADLVRCTKSGGIYGHSKSGLYSPLCHRFQRQRDFVYLAKLWVGDSAAFGYARGTQAARRSYAISLHHGNLFGALRMGVELLWETDGDIDFVSFDDSHEEMMQRWEAFTQYVASHAGFEVKVNYPEKPWYVSLLRDKTDFQVNVRGMKSEFTRGRPPHIHNVSLYYQGFRVYVNGFQNPWVGVRSDPGHDYRRTYLSQQGWVLNFAKSSISCKIPGHPACLPDCADSTLTSDHNRCDESWLLAQRANRSVVSSWRPIALHPEHLRDPVLFL